jgi:excisionase family DNA binding protein
VFALGVAEEGEESGGHRRRIVRPPVPFIERITCTIEEACEVSGLGRSRIYELLADGRLEAVKIDRRRLVKVKSLKALLGEGA